MQKEKKNYKTSLCRHYATKGFCSLFDKCYFAHGAAEMRRRVDPVPLRLPPQLQPVSIYKTQLCRYFMMGFCRNHDSCPFAHGAADLHSMLVTSREAHTAPPRPDYGQTGEFLISILRNLEKVFPGEVKHQVLLKKGLQLIENGELAEANDIINEVVSSSSLTDNQKTACQTILCNAYSLHKISFPPF